MRILHVFRTPVGGLFRHVRDLCRAQQARGHAVGILCDSSTGGDTAVRLLAGAEPSCDLGVKRIPISRLPGLGDVSGVRQTLAHARRLRPDVIHCHGAKGGLYGRVAARLLSIPSVYTPHGGSLHYGWATASGAAFLGAEWLLARIGTGLHFVCRYERDTFDRKIGIGGKPTTVVYNGLWPEEFTATQPAADAAEVLFIGDMRKLKGVDVLLAALGLCKTVPPVRAYLVGDGPDLEDFKAQSEALGLAGRVTFAGRMPAAQAFARGRLLVMPSLAESFPYVVLEAIAAEVPLVASDVGGIPEVLEPSRLCPPGDAAALAARIDALLADPAKLAAAAAHDAAAIRQQFSAAQMADGVLAFYRQVAAA